MKKVLFLIALTSMSMNVAFAGPVSNAAAKMKLNDTRTVTKKINNTEGDPCFPEGISYNIELQVKKASFDRLKSKVVYAWETVKSINVSPSGEVSEVCAE